MTPIVVVQPSVEPVLLSEAKGWLKVELDDTSEDADIQDLISAAREYCEHRKGYVFYEQTLRVSFTGWPCGSRRRIALPRATPLQSIASVSYTDDAGSHVVDAADYDIDTISTPGAIVFSDSYSWPSINVWAPNPIVIEYVAGEPNVSPLGPFPRAIKLAMKQLIAHWYRNREAVIVGATAAATSVPMELGVDALLGVNQAIHAF